MASFSIQESEAFCVCTRHLQRLRWTTDWTRWTEMGKVVGHVGQWLIYSVLSFL